MFNSNNYTIDIISHHPQFDGQTMRKYTVDGIETIGAWGNEPFEIRFKNNTWQKVQVKISVDGLDILSGDLASTEVTKDMWVVNAYGTLSLKAWPENNKGGAQFVFTHAGNSVANHIQGDLSNRGIIAAAVYTEGHVEPIRLQYPAGMRRSRLSFDGRDLTKGVVSTNNFVDICDNTTTSYNASMDSLTLGDSVDSSRDRDLKSLVAVGAGNQVDQNITYVSGLIKPVLSETVRVRYLWWDDLVKKLGVPADPHPTGFPVDEQKRQIMSLGNTPRLSTPKKSKGKVRRSSQPSRF